MTDSTRSEGENNFTLLDLAKREGKSLLIVGPAGIGKFTLAKQLAGEDYLILNDQTFCERFNWILSKHPVIIVELIGNISVDKLMCIKSIISEEKLVVHQKGCDSKVVDTPKVIFTSQKLQAILALSDQIKLIRLY